MKAITFIFLLSTFYGHSQTLISYDKSEGIDFSKYSTYQIDGLDVKNIPEFEQKKEGLDLLISEIKEQMNARGYKEVKESPDLIINLGVAITKEVQTRETNFRDDAHYMGQRNYHWEAGEVVVRKYTEGTVTLDLVDTGKNEMIWQAVSAGALSKKREKNKKKVVKAVQKLYKKYPVAIK